MTDKLKTQKDDMRTEAKRARGLLSLDAQDYQNVTQGFFDHIDVGAGDVVAAYWPKERELDTQFLIDECLDRGAIVVLPFIEADSRVLKFVRYTHDVEMVRGRFGVCHPVVDEDVQYYVPDICIVPLLAFDRRGYRLGFGGGYYDATLAHYRGEKDVLAVGVAYAEQACLFHLPVEEHDIKMDWIVTQQGAQKF